MSLFEESILPEIYQISKVFVENFKKDLKAALDSFDKFEEEVQNGRFTRREKALKDKSAKTALQSINEDEDDPQIPASDEGERSTGRRACKKRSKNEVEGIVSPEQDKRQKRNASIVAQSQISKQVNVNLTQKLRRENEGKPSTRAKRTTNREDDKENSEPVPVVKIKQEKISVPAEPMDTESLPVNMDVKQDPNIADDAMPPPSAPVPRPRRAAAQSKSNESKETDGEPTKRTRTSRAKKLTDPMPPPPVPSASARAQRASSRASSRTNSRAARQPEQEEPQPTGARPKRTRAKKKALDEEANQDTEKDLIQSSEETVSSAASSPADKPKPKRTRRGRKAAEEPDPPKQPEVAITPTEENEITIPNKDKTQDIKVESTSQTNKTKNGQITEKSHTSSVEKVDHAMDETRIIVKTDMDQTVVLDTGVYYHAPVTPIAIGIQDATVVLESRTEQANNGIMDATVVLDKGTKMTDDNSLISDDESPDRLQAPVRRLVFTPPPQQQPQPNSAVKEKVQQFEELASRVTRTKTRAMAKKAEEQENTEKHTSTDKESKSALSSDTLNKMSNLIFNGKTGQPSSSASKVCAGPSSSGSKVCAGPSSSGKIQVHSNTSKLTDKKHEVEDPRQKKEAILEAKRELQRRKREEKMAAAAAAREAAERERLAAADAAAKEKRDKLAQANAGKMARLKEVERKKQEYMRKVAVTEERRKADEAARLQKLEDEQKRTEALRKKQLEEQLQMKKEEAIMAKEIEKRKKEYMEKQKKQKTEEKLQSQVQQEPVQLEPVHMEDGFQYLNSDEEAEPVAVPVPDWSAPKARKLQLEIQALIAQVHIDRLFSVQIQSPDLSTIFPNIDRTRLKRTSSAVWRSPQPNTSTTEEPEIESRSPMCSA